MQGSRSLFQTGIKLNSQPAGAPTGISKSRPFLNVWANRDRTGLATDSVEGKRRMASAATIYEFSPKDKKGTPYPLSQHRGKVLLLVNVASKCGFTPQYTGLETLYQTLSAKYPSSFLILGFPCNQFGGQEPGSDADIQSFCQLNHGVTFPILAKTDVNGADAEPLWDFVKAEKPGLLGMKRVKWNFEKFLVGRDGRVKERWASTTKPEALMEAIEKELKKEAPKEVEAEDGKKEVEPPKAEL
ncbi:MAG: hypothetical protein M1824_004335 [Vezdaea acicularis]|nr:MAG: hypothetical protein M1824_004335 [Vezdaea acicularis]